MRTGTVRVAAILMLAAALSCSGPKPVDDQETGRSGEVSVDPANTKPAETSAGEARSSLPKKVSRRPAWLGKRVLPRGPDGFGIARATPKLLRDRRLATEDLLPPPDSARFSSTVGPVPRHVLERSTWQRRCPVDRRDLAYVTTSFWGFDRRPHTGELIVHRSVARPLASVFRTLYEERWPIEEMRVTTKAELDAPPTGDGNNTGAFVCRPARLSSDWSEHAYGLAVDINPFHNPYVRDRVVLPERALAYRNRAWHRPGMIRAGDVVTRAFSRIGWSWGGDWASAKDWMHFSRSGG